MAATKPGTADSFDKVLLSIRRSTGWTLTALADRFGVSTKTITRYTSGRALRRRAARHSIVYSLRDLDPPLLARAVASLGLTHDFPSGAPQPAVDPAQATVAVEAAFAELMDRLDAGHVRGRRAVVAFLARLVDANVDPGTAKALLAAR